MNRLLSAVVLIQCGVLSSAQIETWNGSSSSMSVPSNWSPSGPPSSGDPLNFPPTATLNLTPNNDIGTFTLYDITNSAKVSTYSIGLTTPAGASYTLSGSPFQVPSAGVAHIQIGGPGTSASIVSANILMNSGALNLSGAHYDQISGVISGTGTPYVGTPPSGYTVYPGAVNIAGGSIQFLGSNTYSGSTYITAGTLQLGASNTLPSTTNVQITSGGILDLNSFSQTIGTFAGDSSSVIITKSGSLTITNSGTNSFGGTIELTSTPPYVGGGGTIALGAGSTGTLTLTGANNYSSLKNIGTTTVTAGTLQAGTGQSVAFGTNSNLTVSLGGTLDANGNTLIFNTIAGAGTISLDHSGAITVNTGGTTFSGAITTGTGGGTDGGINYGGSGTLTLSGTNTYVGPTLISGGGTLVLSNLAATGSTGFVNVLTTAGGTLKFGAAFSPSVPLTLASSGKIDINGNNVTWSGLVSGGGSLTLLNSGGGATLTLNPSSGANAYSGGTIISAGTLALGSANGYPSPAAGTPLSIATGATLNMGGFPITVSTLSGGGTINTGTSGGILTVFGGTTGSSSTYAGQITGSGGLTFSGNGTTLILTGSPSANNYSGATTINGAGTLQVNTAALSTSTSGIVFSLAGGTLQAGSALTKALPISLATSGGASGIIDTNGYAVSWTGTISGSTPFVKEGTGTLTLTPASPNTYTGETRIGAGTLTMGNATALGGTSLVDVQPTGTLDLNDFNLSVEQLIGDPGSFVTLGSGTLTVTEGINTSPYYGVISETGNLTVTSGTPAFMGTNTYSGTTTIQGGATFNTVNLGSTGSIVFSSGGGILQIGSNAPTSSATLQFTDVATISTNTFNLTISGNILDAAGTSFTKIGQGTLTLTGTNSYTGIINLEGGVLNVTSAALGVPSELVFQQFCGTLQSSGAITKSFPITVTTTGIFDTSGGNMTMNGAITGVGGVTKTGTGNLTLGGTNTYAGLTTILGGTLIASTSTSIPLPAVDFAPMLVFNGTGSTFQANATFALFPSVVFLTSGTINTNGHNITSASVIAGSSTATFTKAGAGIFTASGANIYTGPTSVTGGTLRAGVASTASSGAFGVGSDVTLANTAGVTLALANFSNTIGSLAGGGTTGGNVTLGSGTLTISDGNGASFAGAITGTGGVTLSRGIQTFMGSNNYSGTTTISSGATLEFESSTASNTLGAISNSGTLSLNEPITAASYNEPAAATLIIDFPTLSRFGQVAASGTATIHSGSTITITNSGHVSPTGTVVLLSGSSLSGSYTTVNNAFSKATFQCNSTQCELVFTTSGCQAAWTNGSGGNWGTTSNWNPACSPGNNVATDEDAATFNNLLMPGSATITLENGLANSLYLYALHFDASTTNYSIVRGGSNTSTFIMDGNPNSNPTVAVLTGTQSINAPITYNQNGTLSLVGGTLSLGAVANVGGAAGVTLTISGTSGTLSNSAIINPPTVTITGGTINNGGQITPATALNISGGSVTNSTGSTFGLTTAPITISGGSVTASTGSTPQASSLTLSSGSLTSQVAIPVTSYTQSGGTLTLDFVTLSSYGKITASGDLDLGGSLVVTNTGSVVPPTSGTINLLSGAALNGTTFSTTNTTVFPSATLKYSSSLVYLDFTQSSACNGVWTGVAAGNWGTGTNWAACVPGLSGSSSAQDTATFPHVVGAPSTLDVTLAHAGGSALSAELNQLIFAGTSPSYTIIQTGGQGSLTFAGTSPSIQLEAGSHTINAPIAASVNTTIDLLHSGTLTLQTSGNVTGSSGVTLTITGTNGTLANSAIIHPPTVAITGGNINNSGQVTPATALNVSGGTVENLSGATFGTSSTPLAISGGTVTNDAGATLRASTLTLSTGALTSETQISVTNYTQTGGNLTLDFPTLTPGKIVASGALSLGGTLTITNSGSVSPDPGNITLLQGASLSGRFTTIVNPFSNAIVRTSTASDTVFLKFGGCYGTWTATSATGNWGTTSNWSSSCAPGLNAASSDDTATFAAVAPASVTVTLANSAGNAALNLTALYQLNFTSAGTNYTINRFSGNGSITMNSSETPAQINLSAGTHTINAPIILGIDTEMNLTDGFLDFGTSSSVSGSFTLTVQGTDGLWYNESTSIAPSTLVLESGEILNLGTIHPTTLTIGADDSNTLGLINTGTLSSTGALTLSGEGTSVIENYSTMSAGTTFTMGATGTPSLLNLDHGLLFSAGAFSIQGGTVVNAEASNIYSTASSLTISGGTVDNLDYGTIYVPAGQTMTISGGTIGNATSGVIGSLSSDQLATALVFSGGSTTNSGYALAETVTFSGGTVTNYGHVLGTTINVAGGSIFNRLGGIFGSSTSALHFTSGFLDNSGSIVVDDYTQSGTSQLQIEVTSVSQYGSVAASGSASLGGSLIINAASGFSMTSGQTVTFLTATEGLGGTKFANTYFENFSSSLIPSILYSPNSVQLHVGATIPAHFSGSSQILFTSVNQHNSLLMRKSFQLRDRLSPPESASDTTLAANDLIVQGITDQTLRKQQELATREKESKNPWSVYAGPIASFGHVQSTGDQVGLGYTSAGALAGFDCVLPDSDQRPYYSGLGFVVDYRRKWATAQDNWGNLTVDKVHGSLYGTIVPKRTPALSFNGIGGFAYAWDTLNRTTGINLQETATGTPHETIFDLLADIEYTFSRDRFCGMPIEFKFIPLFNVQYIYDHVSQYREQGAGIYDLAVPGETLQSLTTLLGARFDYLFTSANYTVSLEIDAGWQRQYLNGDRQVAFTAFNITNTPAYVTAVGAGENSCLLALDLLTTLYDKVELEASCDLTLNSLFYDAFFYLGIGSEF